MLDTTAGGPPTKSLRATSAQIMRYGLAAAGPVGTAASQFFLSLELLHILGHDEFGGFSFLLVTSQFATGLWSALFCAPLPILLTEGTAESRAKTLNSLFACNLFVAFFAAGIFVLLGLYSTLPLPTALLFACYAGLLLLRWYARAYAYAIAHPLRTVASDLIFSGTLMASVALVALSGSKNLNLPFAALTISAALGMIPFGREFLVKQFYRIHFGDMPHYFDVLKRYSGWSLIGVLTTEATTNAHAYILTLFLGPGSFAPVAASQLMIRPIGVAMNALSEFERPQIARQISAGRMDLAMRAVRFFRYALVFAWVVTAAAAAIMMVYSPGLIFPKTYAYSDLVLGGILWMLVAGVRLLRAPESTLLQAAGAFRPLAYASIISSGISITAVIILLNVGGVMWSVAGILLGEMVFAGWVWRQGIILSRSKQVKGASHAPDIEAQQAPVIAQDDLRSELAGGDR